MSNFYFKCYSALFGVACLIAVTLSLIWNVPYAYTAIGISTWNLLSYLITIDDDLPGGWDNPIGKKPFPWFELVAKVGVVLCLLGLILLYPEILKLGTWRVAS